MPDSPPPPIEQHYTVGEIAKQWKLSDDTVRKMFAEEPGVLTIGQPSRLVGRKYKRRKFVLRIPESAFRRVEQRLMHKRPEPVVAPGFDSRRNLHAG